jgi:hypothetical protein
VGPFFSDIVGHLKLTRRVGYLAVADKLPVDPDIIAGVDALKDEVFAHVGAVLLHDEIPDVCAGGIFERDIGRVVGEGVLHVGILMAIIAVALPDGRHRQPVEARDVAVFGHGIEKAAVIVDALLGTGVRGALREPIRAAVDLIVRARALGIPVVAVDTPTAVDLSSGEPSDPAVRADLTVTFHRPKTGLLTRRGTAHAGKVLVAPIGIPPEADRG